MSNKSILALLILLLVAPKWAQECFDMEITDADFPFNHIIDISTLPEENDNWQMGDFPGGADGERDYTYKLVLNADTSIYITTCDVATYVDVQVAVYTSCNEDSWIFYQDDSNQPIYYPDDTEEQFNFECICSYTNDEFANMLPRLQLSAGTYYIAVEDRHNASQDLDAFTIRTWFGYSLLVDSTSISGSLNSIDYYFNQEVFGGDYQSVYEGSGIGLEISDFSVTIEDNGGNATSAVFTSITNLFNNSLSGGEEEIRLNIEYSAPPSGIEIAIISPASVSSVFNVIGVPLLNVEGDSIYLDEGECFDQELTEEDLPFNRVTDMSIANDNWDFENFSGMEWNAFESQINTRNGKDYTYKLTLTEPRTIYVTTCDDSTDLDVQIAIFTANCDMSSWILYQDDSNFKIVYPDGTWEEYQFECISGFESIPYVGNMIPRIDLEAGDYYVVVDDREYFTDTDGTIGTWIGYSLLIDSTSISENFNGMEYYFNQEVYGGDYPDVYAGNGSGLEISDFSITIESNGGNTDSAWFHSITNLLNNPLSGGEEDIRLNIEYSEPPSGTEVAIISTASESSVFNEIGVPLLDTTGIQINLPDQAPPSLSFNPDVGDTILPTDNIIEITFSERIYLIEGADPDPDNIDSFFDLSYGGSNPESIDFDASIDTNDLIVTIVPTPTFIEKRNVLLTVNANVLQDEIGNLVNQTNASFHIADTTSPEINEDLSSISTSNAFIILSFSEGVYTNINGSGGLELSDFELQFLNNGGNADTVVIVGLQQPGLSGTLDGGEDSIWVFLDVTGPPDGTETIIIYPNTFEIYDSYNNPMFRPVVAPPPINLKKEPWLKEFSLDDDNNYIDLIFSDSVYSAIDNSSPVNIGYFVINFTQNEGGHATDAVISALTKTNDAPLSGGEDTIRVKFSIINPPASGVEEIVITPYNSYSISNSLGNRLDTSNCRVDAILFDRLAPTITLVNMGYNNIISLTTSEGISNIGNGGVNTADFDIDFYKNNEFDSTAAYVQFTDIRAISGDSLYGNDTTVYIFWETIGGPASGTEEIAIRPRTSSSIFDQAGNPMPNTAVSERISLPDMFPPKFVPGSASISSDNSYVIFTLTEGVYGDWETTTPAEPSDFFVEFIPNDDDATATGANVDYITNSRQFPLVGGEDTLRCYLNIQGTPSGHERLFIRAADDSLLYDASRNPLPPMDRSIVTERLIWSPDKATDTLQLFDQLVPTEDTISIDHGSDISSSIESPIAITFSEPIQSFGYTVSARHYNYLSYIADTTATVFTITLQPPMASLDTITLSIFNLTDSAGLTLEVPLRYDYYTIPLGDYNIDGKVNVEDLAQFVLFWTTDSQPAILGLGPTSGTFPHLVPELDGNYDLDDGMTFIRMWSWSLERWGLEPQVASNIGTAINWDKLVIDVPMEAIAGQVYLRYDPNQGKVDLQHSAFGNNNFTLKKELADHGEVLLEFGLVEPNNDTKIISIKSEIDEPAEATVIYKFFAKDRSLIAAGTQKIALVIPTEFRLMQNYPNPFNNTTTIRYAVPEETDIQLEIFDISGRLVETLISQLHQPGFYDLKWSGRQAASGIYFIKLEAAKTVLTQKMILLK